MILIFFNRFKDKFYNLTVTIIIKSTITDTLQENNLFMMANVGNANLVIGATICILSV